MPITAPALESSSTSRLSWLTDGRCRLIAAAIILLSFAGHLFYLTHNCPLDLAEDEAYYWDWSRQLDICYYSKGPITASLIRASCALFGNTMPAVRLPALLMGAGLAACMWHLTRLLFGSARLALGTVLLCQVVPMFSAAGLIITTDPPFLFLWSLAMCLAAEAIFNNRRWAWAAAGAAVGIGFLTKFPMPLWLAAMFFFLLIDPQSRPLLRTRWPWIVPLAALPFTLPVIIWNARHGWVTFLHVREDVGADQNGQFLLENAKDFWLGQIGVIGPLLFALIIIAILAALWWQTDGRHSRATAPSDRRALRFLLVWGLPIFAGVIAVSLRTHPAANWPAASYIALIILAAYFIARQMHSPGAWRFWRYLVYPAILLGFAHTLIAHKTEAIYPLVRWWNQRHAANLIQPRKLDPTARLKGWTETAAAIDRIRSTRATNPLIMAGDYPTAAELAFYLSGQPKTYCIGSWFRHAKREPFNQYDIWPDRSLDPSRIVANGLAARDAIYVGPPAPDLLDAFDRVDRLEEIVIERHGFELRRLQVWYCTHFKGLPWPGWEGRYNK